MPRDTTKVFVSGRCQAVRIPIGYRFDTDEVFIERDGDRVILTPKPKSWARYFREGKRFSDDFPNQIEDIVPEKRQRL